MKIKVKIMSDVIFEVMSLDESAVVGQISKQWGGFMQEAFTDADDFGISFPMDLDVEIKAVMLGACFLIDFMFFENKPEQPTELITNPNTSWHNIETLALIYQSCMKTGADLSAELVLQQDTCDL